MEKFLENLQKAEKTINTCDHIVYVTFPLIKDKNLLLKVFTETKKGIGYCINAILQYEYLYKRIKLFKNPKINLRTFQEKCSIRYNITKQENNLITNLFNLAENHKKSSMEFMRNEKIIILSENLETKSISIEKIKEFLILAKNILEKSKNKILR
ncbi:MAG: hypothetical protein KKF48_00895 [Nanoarchaeota archaeon]|nr:hypothetical protein [Nanoarchaeota archaeon]MBU1027580.1 hypothetical protein [Nanoarchaeota archaeon]